MKKLLIIVLIVGISFISVYLYYKEGAMPPDRKNPASKIFVIKKGEGLDNIARSLESEGLIRNRVSFFITVKLLGLEKKIQAGDFRLSTDMTAYEVATSLTHGTLDTWTTIIEGLRKEEIAQVISQNFDIPEIEFNKTAEEGYLFPDTYLIPRSATAESIISILKDNFEKKYSNDLKNKARKLKLSDYEIIILASIVEKEARQPQDKLAVAGILLKRLANDWPLQVDATIQYALGYQANERTWWKKILSHEDLEIDSPYNSYKNKGLPPTPICNPGLVSITAVINGNVNTPYWFYISDKNGNMHYAKTSEEHEANIARYLN